MARTPEGNVKAACVAVLESFGAYYHFTVTGGYGKSGAPDIFVCYLGLFIGIECKAEGNTPTELQKQHLDKIVTARGIALVIREDNINLLVSTLERIRSESKYPAPIRPHPGPRLRNSMGARSEAGFLLPDE